MRIRVASRAELVARDRHARQPVRYLSCQWCGEPMPDGLRSHARYCKASCRVLASRTRRRAATALESVNRAKPEDPPTAGQATA